MSLAELSRSSVFVWSRVIGFRVKGSVRGFRGSGHSPPPKYRFFATGFFVVCELFWSSALREFRGSALPIGPKIVFLGDYLIENKYEPQKGTSLGPMGTVCRFKWPRAPHALQKTLNPKP